MYEVSRKGRKILFQPLVLPHFTVLLFFAIVMYPIFFFSLGSVFTYGLGLSSAVSAVIIWFSLLGSSVNFPLKEIVSNESVIFLREVSFFGFKWVIPNFAGRRRTIIAINLGGAIVPLLVSSYLLIFAVLFHEVSPVITYAKIFVVTTVVILFTNKFSRIIPGFGIAVPALIPPLISALVTMSIFDLFAPSNPSIIAYISGTLGTIIGADLLNLSKISKTNAPLVSIGGAGTFDGIYITGIMSVALVLLML